MKWVIGVLFGFLVLLQASLWFGDGSLPRAWQLEHAIEQQKLENARLRERNKTLEAEVQDLKQGLDVIEERARTELGMIQQGEVFYHVIED